MSAYLDRPLDYWMDLARMGFEDGLHRLMDAQNVSQSKLAESIAHSEAYVSQVLNGTGRKNFSLKTLVKFARAVGAIVQIRLALDGREVVRVMDMQEASEFDARHDVAVSHDFSSVKSEVVTAPATGIGKILPYERRGLIRASASETGTASQVWSNA